MTEGRLVCIAAPLARNARFKKESTAIWLVMTMFQDSQNKDSSEQDVTDSWWGTNRIGLEVAQISRRFMSETRGVELRTTEVEW